MDGIETILFDIDGTLCDWKTGKLLPGVAEWFKANGHKYKIALVTNQGGVGLRHWMEDGGFGEPGKYPTEDQARAHIDAVNNAIGPYPVFVCFAYQAKSGKWSPIPDGCEDDPEWQQDRRKPAPGMIYDAIRYLRTTRAKTLFVGDLPEDMQAANNADVAFQHADRFFNRRGA